MHFMAQGDQGGQRLCFIDFFFEIPQYCPTALPFLPNSYQPKKTWADSGTTEAKSTKPSLTTMVTLYSCLVIRGKGQALLPFPAQLQ